MKQLFMWFVLTTGFAVMMASGSDVALSSDSERQWEDDDYTHDRARRAVDRGETLPIAEILERLKFQVPGEVVGFEFGREDGKWVYEFKVINDRGRLLEVYVDAETGAVLSMEED